MAMNLKYLTPRKALNKAFLKIKPTRTNIESFKENLIILLDKIQLIDQRPNDESEEHLKNDIRDFLRDTYYRESHAINTKDKKDLVIHISKDTNSNVGVIIEAKRPKNKAEMISRDNINKKAFQELVLYYLRERISNKNHDVKHLVISNINEWFIFDEHLFERLFANNKKFVKQFENFEFSKKSTQVFYDEIAKPFISEITAEIEFTYFNIQDYQQPLRNTNKNDDNTLIALFKLLSPEHLLKLPFTNDSNSLDKNFYNELLHLIGLTETKEGSKKIIDRLEPNQRNAGSLLENTINQLDSLDKLSRVSNIQQFGENNEQRLFNVGLELCITWVNRILFLKLLEAQLIAYHKGDKAYSFLNNGFVKDFDNMNSLFFMVLAKKHEERNNRVKDLFERVPYLNSSLFEPTVLEHEALFISGLEDNISLPLLNNTVIKNINGKKRTGNLNSLDYIFDFLNAYDFAGEGTEDIQEENKTLINASVLGLIFEKINGYKDGSFFTPGFITMYMCRETIRKAVVQKFNKTKGWKCVEFDDLYDKIEDRKEANDIVNSLKICDPAVGSGHFLVSALNEMIAIKNDLKILQDRQGKRLKEYTVEVVNDELIVTDDEGELFEYFLTNKESQRIQETLFHEKQTIIENCLFGVDINPNSVKICRLRLWIELLKNTYYKNSTELETLPNIDINIKCGNSLVSRFAIDADIKQALKKSKWSIDSYRLAVDTYRNAESKEQKREMERLISDIKSDFRSEVSLSDPKAVKFRKVRDELFNLTTQTQLFEMGKKEKANWNKKVAQLTQETKKLETEIEEIKANKIFENAFEWRIEFPEVLNDNGEFMGFDVLIGNPPYGVKFSNEEKIYLKNGFRTILGKYDSYGFFIEKGLELLGPMGMFGYIIPHTWLTVIEASQTRNLIFNTSRIIEIDKLPGAVFEDATVDTTNLILRKEQITTNYNVKVLGFNLNSKIQSLDQDFDSNQLYSVSDWIKNDSINLRIGKNENTILDKMLIETVPFNSLFDFSVGVQAYDSYSGQSKETIQNRVFHANYRKDETYLPELNGSDVERYAIHKKKESWISYGNWLAHPRSEKHFFNPRILIREITNKGKYKIVCCYTEEKSIHYKSILNIISPNNNRENLLIILGILNSSLMSWYFDLNSNKLDSNTFPRISLVDLKKFPLKLGVFESKISKIIKQKTLEILEIKKSDPNRNTTIIEKEIDKLVFELYGVEEEEIKLIETT